MSLARTRASAPRVRQYARYLNDLFAPPFTTLTNELVGRVYLSPIQIPFTVTVDRCAYIPNVQAGNVRLGIYRDNGDTPVGGALLVESASLAVGAINTKDEKVITDTQLTEGLYWLAAQFDDITVKWYIDQAAWVGGGTVTQHRYDHVYGAFTDPCPASPIANNATFQFVRVASIP